MSSITELENQKWNEVLNSPEGKETADQFFARLKQQVFQRNHKEAKSHVVYH